MKYWIRLLALVFCVLLICAIIGSLLPHGYSLEASREIAASPVRVYEQLESLPKWKSWSQWNTEEVKSLSIDYASDGKSQRWSDVRGEGKLWFESEKENERIDYRMRFANFPEMQSSIVLEPKGDNTLVKWSSEGVLPSGPFYGFFRHIFVDGMTTQYEQSLDKLKKLVEEGAVETLAVTADESSQTNGN